MVHFLTLLVFSLVCALTKGGRTFDFAKQAAVEDDDSLEVMNSNRDIFNAVLSLLQAGDTFVVPLGRWYMQGGVVGSDIHDVRILIDGELVFNDDRSTWPKREGDGGVQECILLRRLSNVTFSTSSDSPGGTKGVINGNGRKWWGAVRYLVNGEDRPRLLHLIDTKDIHIRHLLLLDSPFWSFWSENSDGLFITHSDVSARITDRETHDIYDLTAFNTDGWDVSGRNVHIADSSVWVQDDCISVKDSSNGGPSENMLFERITCSGLGLVVGSIGSSQVRNITFRDSVIPDSYKAIYLKTRWSDLPPSPDVGISDILYENIRIERCSHFPIWIGPAQQAGSDCSLAWPHGPAQCRMSGHQSWTNIVLRNITIVDPLGSPGVIFGNATNAMSGIVFDGVRVTNPGGKPWGADYYYCRSADIVLAGGTTPKFLCT